MSKAWTWALALGLVLIHFACTSNSNSDASADGGSRGTAGATGTGGLGGTAGFGGMSGLGGAGGMGGGDGCTDDTDCGDDVNCTHDACVAGACWHDVIWPFCLPMLHCDREHGCVQNPACATDVDCFDLFNLGACIGNVHCAEGECVIALLDKDGDGIIASVCGGSDCNDVEPAAYSGADEICDGIDNDCNGGVDDIPLLDLTRPQTCGTCDNNCFAKLINADPLKIACIPSQDPGHVPGLCQSGGCIADYYDLDNDGSCEYFCLKSGDIEICGDGLDNNCNGKIDEPPSCP